MPVLLKQKQMLFVKLFVHFECYACVGREEEFWYKFALQHKGI